MSAKKNNKCPNYKTCAGLIGERSRNGKMCADCWRRKNSGRYTREYNARKKAGQVVRRKAKPLPQLTVNQLLELSRKRSLMDDINWLD